MCDYSLEAFQSRPARKGEEYISNRFPSGNGHCLLRAIGRWRFAWRATWNWKLHTFQARRRRKPK